MTLRLNGTSSGFTEIDAPAAAGSNKITLPASNGSAEQFLKNSGTAGELEFSSMVETSTGVGIGTTSPGRKLEVNSGTSDVVINAVSSDSGSYISFEDDSTTGDTYVRVGAVGNNLTFDANNDERARINTSGTLQIGGTANLGSQRLQVHGSDENTADVIIANSTAAVDESSKITFAPANNVTGARIQCVAEEDFSIGANRTARLEFYARKDGTLAEKMRINSNGTVLIGNSIIGDSSDGQGILFTDGGFIRMGNSTGSGSSTMAEFKTGSGNTQVLRFQCDGDIENQNNRYSGISDVNLKENIVDAGSQWDDIKNIRVRKYNFREDTGLQTNTQIGVIAQEVELISPGLVKEVYDVAEDGSDLETTRKSVSYSVLYMKAVKALQEAQTRIETLETQNTAQQTQIDDLLARVTALEAA